MLPQRLHPGQATSLTAPFRAGGARLRGLLRRFHGDPHAAAYDEILARFARANAVRDVHTYEIEAIAERHGVSLDGPLRLRTITFYRDYLRHCLSDRHLSEEELTDLGHLRRALRLDRDAVELSHRRVAREIYSRTVNEVLADSTIDSEERTFLSNLRDALGLPPVVAENIEQVRARQRGARDAIPPKRSERRV
jgi:hypothetical protein